jgi:diadenosine tetraphosphatase ApaH/serine/threonine PP2A family protein phosphatase
MAGPSNVHYAIISCVHANLEALQAVLDDAGKRGIERIISLGDLVGFGPDPVACVDIARQRGAINLKGCHDQALLDGGAHLPAPIRGGIAWAKEELTADEALGAERMAFFQGLPESYEAGGIAFRHASPHDAVNEYLFPEDVRRDTRKLQRAFNATEKIVFVGHVHVPGIFLENPVRWTPAAQLENYFHYKKGEKVIVNVGSVGQPRDGDRRACYLEVKKNELYWRRVEYDVDAVVAKIKENARLAPSAAQRLLRGI